MNLKPPRPTEGLEKARADALLVLDGLKPNDPEYAKVMAQVETLSKLIQDESRELLSPNTVATAVSNLLAVGLIVNYERLHIAASKAFTLIGTKIK
jgi:hypothetical protein